MPLTYQTKRMEIIKIDLYHSPVGEMLLGSFAGKLCICDWLCGKRREANGRRVQKALEATYKDGRSDTIRLASTQLDEYFARERRTFDLPLLLIGSPFQNAVWQELLNIPYGSTLSYGELSRRVGNPKAVRAVAAANGVNPLSIFVPCHRVIGSGGQLVGYAGGLDTKRELLRLECGRSGLLS